MAADPKKYKYSLTTDNRTKKRIPSKFFSDARTELWAEVSIQAYFGKDVQIEESHKEAFKELIKMLEDNFTLPMVVGDPNRLTLTMSGTALILLNSLDYKNIGLDELKLRIERTREFSTKLERLRKYRQLNEDEKASVIQDIQVFLADKEHPCDPCATNTKGWNILHLAIYFNQEKLVEFIAHTLSKERQSQLLKARTYAHQTQPTQVIEVGRTSQKIIQIVQDMKVKPEMPSSLAKNFHGFYSSHAPVSSTTHLLDLLPSVTHLAEPSQILPCKINVAHGTSGLPSEMDSGGEIQPVPWEEEVKDTISPAERGRPLCLGKL